MKAFIGEIIDPVKIFYRMRNKGEKAFIIFIPIFMGILCFGIGMLVPGSEEITMLSFTNDILSQFITIITLFISFTMGYLTIIISSSSENIERLKETDSKNISDEEGKPYKLYQILTTEITYTIIVDIFFLTICVIEKFLVFYLNVVLLKTFCSINVIIFAHILILMLVTVKNIYYSFWRPD